MKKALVMMFVLVLGLGFAASAVSLAGEWSGTVEFDPGAAVFADFLTDFSSDLSVTYSIGSFSVTSDTGFDSDGYASQAFSAEATLGALIFSSEMNFIPAAVPAVVSFYTYSRTITFAGVPVVLPAQYEDFLDPFWWGGLAPELIIGAETVTPVDAQVITLTFFGLPVAWAAVAVDPAPAFDDWTVEASISLAGVNLGGLFFFEFWPGTGAWDVVPVYEYEYMDVIGPLGPPWPPIADLFDITPEGPFIWNNVMVQTGSWLVDNSDLVNVGAGWRFMISGTLSPVTITSYTYFNLIEGFAMDDDPDTKSFDRNGEFEIAFPDQVVRFTEEYIVIEGLSLGCIEADAALRITCENGFEYFSLWFKNIYLLCCGISTDFEIDFLLAEKRVELFPTITIDWVCWEPTVTLDWDENVFNGITLDALSVEVSLNGLTFSATTAWDGSMGTLDSGGTEDWAFLVPADQWYTDPITGLLLAPAVFPWGWGIYEVERISIAEDYYELFESFTITYESDSCCGGLFEITMETLFGNRFTETLAEYGYWYETNAVLGNPIMAYGQGLYFDVADTLNPAPGSPGTFGSIAGWFFYNDWYITQWWYPGDGTAPVFVEDIAYSALIGLDGTPSAYPPALPLVPALAESVTSAFATTKTAAGGQLFGWAQTSVDVSLGIGSNLTLEFGLDVGAYGWTRASFGFIFSF